MKHPRDERKWTNEELAESPQAYLRAQEARREDEAAERAREDEQWDLEAFTVTFVAGGGSRSEAEDAWRRRRAERAAESASTVDEAARRVQHGAVMGRL